MSTILFENYQVNNSINEVKLSVNVGHGQPSTTTYYVGNTLVETIHHSFDSKVLGTNKDLKGSQLSCITVVHDFQTITNETSVTLQIDGGKEKFRQLMQKKVSNHGDVVIYIAKISFV